MSGTAAPRDPRTAGPAPPTGQDEIAPPGRLREMDPPADHGETSYEGHGRLTGRTAVITGGDSGIGRAVAIAYAREGADVVISYLNEHEDAEDTAGLVRDAGRRAVTMAGDIGDEAHCRELVRRTVAELGRLDVLVNNAAFQMEHRSILDIPSEEIEYVVRTNLLSLFWTCRAAIPHMAPGSSIINTSSIQSYTPSPSLLHYATTKGGITTFTKGLAQELIERGIRVNAVAPGPVWTPLVAMSFPGGKLEHFGESSPMGRPAQPAELAPLYVFLASDESRFVVGEIVGITGGKPIS